MNILEIIAQNLQRDIITKPFSQQVPAPSQYRGLVQLDPEQCVGCTTCAYVCSSGAIEVINRPKAYEWRYDPGRCMFCYFCVEVCPCQALTMSEQRPVSYTEPETQRQSYHMPYPACALCGRPAPPVTQQLLLQAFGEITDEIRHWSRLCPHCRQQHYQPALLEVNVRRT